MFFETCPLLLLGVEAARRNQLAGAPVLPSMNTRHMLTCRPPRIHCLAWNVSQNSGALYIIRRMRSANLLWSKPFPWALHYTCSHVQKHSRVKWWSLGRWLRDPWGILHHSRTLNAIWRVAQGWDLHASVANASGVDWKNFLASVPTEEAVPAKKQRQGGLQGGQQLKYGEMHQPTLQHRKLLGWVENERTCQHVDCTKLKVVSC